MLPLSILSTWVVLGDDSYPTPPVEDRSRRGPDPNPDDVGPLGYGQEVRFEVAEDALPGLSLPSASELTGDLDGIWLADEAPGRGDEQVGVLWSSDLVFYVREWSETEGETVAAWTLKVEDEPDAGWVLVTTRNHMAVGRDGEGGGDKSSLTWVEGGFVLQFVSPSHTMQELKSVAETIP